MIVEKTTLLSSHCAKKKDLWGRIYTLIDMEESYAAGEYSFLALAAR